VNPPHGVGDTVVLVLGAILVLVVIFVAGPIGLFLTGAIWSGLFGWLQSDLADQPKDSSAA
jgi:hypothetical protein